MLIKYPLSLIGVPSNSIPSFQPNLSISFGGITIIHLYIVLPLYSLALTFCSFISKDNVEAVYKCDTTKFIYP